MSDSPTLLAAKRVARDGIRRLQLNWPNTRDWGTDLIAEYGRLIMRAGGSDLEAIHDGIQAAIEATPGNFPPTPSDAARHVRTLRLERQREREAAERIRSRRDDPHPRCEWLGWLAFGAHHAHLRDTGRAAPHSPAVAPYLALCEELGYRNRHGCDDDPEYDPTLAAEAQQRAEAIWRNDGQPEVPPIAALVTGRSM